VLLHHKITLIRSNAGFNYPTNRFIIQNGDGLFADFINYETKTKTREENPRKRPLRREAEVKLVTS